MNSQEVVPPDNALKNWEVVETWGKSGQSTVWKVRSRTTGRLGVLKTPQVKVAQLERLQREIRILLEIDHAAVVRPLDASADGELPWLITPLGVPLDVWWREFCSTASVEERFERARQIVLNVADGLKTCHQRGIVHRDLKPENIILLKRDGVDQAVLIDFGVAYVLNEPRLTELDGRAIRNRFVSPPQAYYQPIDDPPPWWDCLGLAWIWAWMIGAVDLEKRFRFHWKYHPLIEHPKSPLFRALLAACSSETVGPVDGEQFIALMYRLGLGDQPMPTDKSLRSEFAAAAAAAALAEGEHVSRTAERVEAVESAAAVLGVIYDDLLASLEQLVVASGLPLRAERLWQEPAANSLTRLGADDEHVVTLLEIVGSRPAGNFQITLKAAYRPLPKEFDAFPFVFTVESHGTFAIAWNSLVHRRDGTALLYSSLSPVPPDTFIQRVRDHIMQPTVWNPEPIL